MIDTNTLAPSDAELMQVIKDAAKNSAITRDGSTSLRIARAVLAKWGAPAPESSEPVAVVGSDFTLYWAGSGPVAPLVERHGLKVGSPLYAAPQAQPVAWPAGTVEHGSTPLPGGMGPAAWAATSEEGIVEALGMNQSRRFDIPLYTASQAFVMARQAGLQRTNPVQAMLTTGLAPGWQAVPVEPTEEQLAAVRQKPHPTNPNGWGVNHRRIYRAMLAAAPSGPARVQLTDEQIQEIISKLDPLFLDTPQGFETDFARAIERAHGITAAQEEADHG